MVENKRRSDVVIPVAIAAVAAVIAVVMFVVPTMGSGGESEGGEAAVDRSQSTREAESELARREQDDPMALGDEDAPVVMVSYSDFQCPFCGKFARDVEPELVEQYVKDGTLRIEWRDFPYLGAESMTAAKAGRAAARQDRFWEFHDAMYADQLPPNSGDLDRSHVKGIAEDVGLDVERFLTDMEASSTEQAVKQDFREGQSLGVTGTPTFVINNRAIVGAQPVEAFEQVIEQAAAEAAK